MQEVRFDAVGTPMIRRMAVRTYTACAAHGGDGYGPPRGKRRYKPRRKKK